MTKIDISEAENDLLRYLERVENGEMIVICRREVPIAEIRPIPKRPSKPRPVGIDRGMTIPSSFFDPLPDDLLDEFECRQPIKAESGQDSPSS